MLNSKNIRLLYVDDEENNLIAFRAFFWKKYEVYTANSAADAFKIMESVSVHVIISDQRMPNTTGIEFLEKTCIKYPDCIRLLITAQSDIEVIIDAINRGQISKYIQKPWDWEKLSIIIEHCADMYFSKNELKIKNEELQKTNDELNRFVYSVSHDLRSPLMSILGIIQLSKLNDEMKAAEEYFKIIETSVLKLDNFIKDIIEYYKNSRSEEVLDKIHFKELVTYVIDTMKNQDSSINFEVDVEQEGTFIGDLFRIRVILNNLISNAIKYQRPDVVQHDVNIKVRCSEKAVQITITDNGIGILKEHIENIFKLFFRTQNAQNTQGSGIGLFIVKEALEKIGGSISVDSTPMVGSSFKILIPNKKSI